jgi:hypothetical protein
MSELNSKYLKANTFVIQIPEKVIGKTNKLVNSLTSKGLIANNSVIITTSKTDNKIRIINEGIYESLKTKPKETKPKETKPKETKPKETKPKETKPKETKIKESKHKESKPKEEQPKENKLTPNKAALLIQNKFKNFMYPFINRVTANIYDRELYYYKLLKKLKINVNNNNNCLKFHKLSNDKPEFIINDVIHLKNQFGSKSKFGINYISSFKDNDGKLFKYSIKIVQLNQIEEEIKYLELLKVCLLKHKTPHFPLLYATLHCNDMRTETKGLEPDIISKFPKLLINTTKKKTPIVILLNELANGDLKNFVHEYYDNYELLANAFVQVQLAILSFNLYASSLHFDTHWGNFLFHKIKSGGYFHYKINDVDYYLKNLGFLWVIWDFGRSKHFSTMPNIMSSDGETIYRAFMNKNNNGWVDNKIKLNKNINKEILTLWQFLFDLKENKKITSRLYTSELMNTYISILFKQLLSLNWIFTKTPPKSEIINDKPYIIKFVENYEKQK